MKSFQNSLLHVVFIVFCFQPVYAQKTTNKGFFAGYETLEMSMNKFQNFAGEIGYRISSEHQLRLTIGEVKLTERHLSSEWEAYAVDGENVEGYFRIYELNYDRFFFKRKTWYAGSQCGLCSGQIPFHHLGRSHRQ